MISMINDGCEIEYSSQMAAYSYEDAAPLLRPTMMTL
jgi:hypothetical protein